MQIKLSAQIIPDHLGLRQPQKARRRGIAAAFLCILFAVAAGVTVWLLAIETTALGALLTATSIMTGLTFTMAMRFWERSIDARSNPDLVFNTERLDTLDSMRTTLLWTVLAGLISTTWLAGAALSIGSNLSAAWVSGVSAALVAYQLAYVFRSLISLYAASYSLR